MVRCLALLVSAIFLLFSCQPSAEVNPPAEGFNVQDSDPEAIEIADKVMEAMGGRQAWNNTQVITWNFFGNRHLIWNKQTGDVRIDAPRESATYLINIFDKTGKVKVGDHELTMQDSLGKYLNRGQGMWINDAYWLVMPFKLKDSGVTLKYLRDEATKAGADAHVLQLTFNNVGNTPDNKYEVWVDKSDYLIKQWAYFAKYDQDEPNYIRPWDNYKQYGEILLSGDRSDESGPRSVQVLPSVPSSVFTEWDVPAPVSL